MMKKGILLGTMVAFAVAFSACNQATDQNSNEAGVEVVEASVTVAVDGMMCAMGCAGKIEKTLNETPGVNSASVDFEAGTATIAYNASELSEEDVIGIIEDVNDGQYEVSMMSESLNDEEGKTKSCTKPCDKPCTAEEKAACKSKGMKKECGGQSSSEA